MLQLNRLILLFLIGSPFAGFSQCSLEEFNTLLFEANNARKAGKYDLAINKLLSAQICQSEKPEKVEEVKKKILNIFYEINQLNEEVRKQRDTAQIERGRALMREADVRKQRDTIIIERNNAIRLAEEARRQRDSANLERNNALAQKRVAEDNAREYYANDLAYKSQVALNSGNLSVAYRLADFAKRFVHQDNPNVNKALSEALYYNDHPDSMHRLAWYYDLLGHANGVTAVAVSPEGNLLASGSLDSEIKVWDLGSRQILMELEGLKGQTIYDDGRRRNGIMCINFSPDAKKIAAGFYDNPNAVIWDISTGQTLLVLQGHTRTIRNVIYSPDGKMILTVSDDHTALLWNAVTGEIIREIGNDKNWVHCIAFSHDSRFLATGNILNSTVNIQESVSGKQVLSLKGNSSYVNSIAFFPDGKRIATGAEDGSLKVWNLSNGKEQFSLNAGGGIAEEKGVNQIICFPNCQWLATISHDRRIKIWEIGTQNLVLSLKSEELLAGFYSTGFSISPNGRQVIAGSKDHAIRIWDVSVLKNISTLEGHEQNVIRCLAYSPDGTKLLTGGSSDYTAKLWDLTTGRSTRSIKHHDLAEGHQDVIWRVAFSPDGTRIATATSAPDDNVKIWDANTGRPILSMAGHSGALTSVAFSPNGAQLATGGFSDAVNLWNLSTGKIICTFKGHKDVVSSLSFSPDGKYMATSSWDGTAKIWDLSSGEVNLNIEGHSGRVQKVVFSKSANLLATCSSDSTAKIWNIQTGKLIRTFEGHQDWVLSVAFSPDEKWLATCSSDGTTKIWNLESGKIEHTLTCHIKWVWDCAFSPDSKQLATVAWNNTIHLWPIGQPENQIAHLNSEQLLYFGLDRLPDQLPNNENMMIETRDTWQISAFADLYFQKIAQYPNPKKEDYERAKRFYTACLSYKADNSYFEKKLADLEWLWKEKQGKY